MVGKRSPWHDVVVKLSGEAKDRIEELLQIVGLVEERDVRAGQLSHGQKQWLEIGMLLAQEPRLLLVDEPVAGMTHTEMERTAELLCVARRRARRRCG